MKGEAFTHLLETDALAFVPGVARREGLYVCTACGRVNEPSQREIDLAESMPAATVELKCLHCRRRCVRWFPPAPDRAVKRDAQGARVPAPVSADRARELFAQLRQVR